MRKTFLFVVLFSLFSLPTVAETVAETEEEENAIRALEEDVRNLNTIPMEKRIKILSDAHKKSQYRLRNYPKQKKKAIVKFTRQMDKHYKRLNNIEYEEPEPIDVDNDIEMKYFFQKSISFDNFVQPDFE